MNEDYLWDRSGAPDPDVERLEHTLAPLRYRPRPELAGIAPRRPSHAWAVLAAAATIAAAAILVSRNPAGSATPWQVSRIEGSASVAGKAVDVATRLRAGQLLRTANGSQLTLQSDDVGRIDLGPASELRASSARKVLLQRGQLHAFIWAPPREFVVDTPSARAVDLGCEYTLNVDAAGNGLLHVEMGWVAFQYDDRESFIPAGAECITRGRRGPGIPFYADAPSGLRASLAAFETGDSAALPEILRDARPRDALTLWHLLTRVPAASRAQVYDRFAQFVKLPKEASRAAVLAGDRRALDACWNALDLENTGWWRGWERPWR